MADTNLALPCPCGSENQLADCCLPIIQGKRRAETAEQLLRARYSAFTRGDVDFIMATHHSKTRGELKRDETEAWSKNSEWLGLKIVQIDGGRSEDEQATIIFNAMYRADGKDEDHWEKSYFQKENGLWYFLDAQGIQTGTYKRSEPKVGRNDPCSCGSGKKYKKCCGK